MTRLPFYKILVLLSAALFGTTARAELITVQDLSVSNPSTFQRQSGNLKANDEVRFIDGDGKIEADFKIVEKLSKNSSSGHVFEAVNEEGKTVTVKFPKSNYAPITAMDSEVRALKAAITNKIPAVEVYRYVPGLFCEREYVSGETLREVSETWNTLRAQERSDRIVGLLKFIQFLKDSDIELGDLNSENIIWNGKIWKILDATGTQQSPKESRKKPVFLEKYLEKSANFQMRQAFLFSVDHPEWTERYTKLQATYGEIHVSMNLNAAETLLQEISTPPRDAPAEYVQLWSKGLADIKLLHAQGRSTPLIDCLIRRFATVLPPGGDIDAGSTQSP